MERIVVIGAGQAASSLMVKLRSQGFEGEILLIGEEPHLPYQRPPLSKKYLAGEMPAERLLLRQAGWYEKNRIDAKLGAAAARIDPEAKQVALFDGETVAYDQLALTTGARPRRLPPAIGGDLPNVFTMRDLADADALSAVMTPGRRVLVIGGGYIGLEAAAEAAKKGLEVTLIEAAERILQRVAAVETADYFRDLHRARGVTVVEGVGIERLARGDGDLLTATLGDGSVLDVDLVIVGIGIQPNSELAAEAGIEIELGGIRVDAFGRTSDPAIFAAGDCACLDWKGRPIRLESVQNAQDQAANVALNMLGEATAYKPEPWFWSDQYDVKLQIAGLNLGYDQVIKRDGPKPCAAAHFYFAGDELLAVDAMNDPVSYNVVKRLLAAGRSLPKALAADPTSDLKAFLTSG
ncbi:MAG: FAD-dependent oxidoreductase [Alphaproteobacteria bacterium]|nr:FAD-dependent oxidoreductase [Alphaproteobacteria bacterium]